MPQIYVELVSVNYGCTVRGYLQILSHRTHVVKVCLDICIVCVCVCVSLFLHVTRLTKYIRGILSCTGMTKHLTFFMYTLIASCVVVALSDKRRVKALVFLGRRL
jgi:hypothetical protein